MSIKTLVSDFFENTYRIRRLRGKSPETSRLYRITIRNFEKSLGRPAFLSDLTNDNVSALMQFQLDRGRTKATANKDRQQLLTIWRYATQQGLHETWPDVPAEVEPQRVPQAWLADDLQKLFATVDGLTKQVGDVPGRLWWRGVLMTCLDTGERIGAVRQLRWEWLESDWVLFPAEVRKGGKRDRRYMLSQHTCNVLAEIKKHVTGPLAFPWPYSDGYIWASFGNLLASAGLPKGRRDKFHRMRRTTASVVHQAGMDATEALDHQQRRTTQRYLDPRFARERQPSKALEDFLRNPPKDGQRRKLG